MTTSRNLSLPTRLQQKDYSTIIRDGHLGLAERRNGLPAAAVAEEEGQTGAAGARQRRKDHSTADADRGPTWTAHAHHACPPTGGCGGRRHIHGH